MKIAHFLSRFIKLLGLVLLCLIAIVVWAFMSPPTYEVEYKVPASKALLIAQFQPTSPHLAEYERSIVIHGENGKRTEVKLFPDTGGYLRGQLYEDANGLLYLKGYFDLVQIDPKLGIISETKGALPKGMKYLGAFDSKRGIGFLFLPATESPEQSLVAQGG